MSGREEWDNVVVFLNYLNFSFVLMVVEIFKSYQYSNILVSLQARMSDLGIGAEVSFGSRWRSDSSLVKG